MSAEAVVQVTQDVAHVVEVSPPRTHVVEVVQAPGPRGLSAYQLALLEGFVGTQAEWLASLVGGDISGHVNDPAPHPAYDDMPSLTLVYENGLI